MQETPLLLWLRMRKMELPVREARFRVWKQLMLEFHPERRITVEEALAHPYLASLHDPTVEPASEEPAPFEFDFEDEELREDDLRRKVWEEMLCFHGEAVETGGAGVVSMMT